MTRELDFERPVLELERKIEELRRIARGDAEEAPGDQRPTLSIPPPPKQAERPNADQMSTTPSPLHKLPNQWIEKPRIGNVRPPVGPWNDSTRIVRIGP